MRLVDSLNPFVGKQYLDSISNDLTTIDVVLTPNGTRLLKNNKSTLKELFSVRVSDKSLFKNDYIKSKVFVDGKKYKAKLKFHAGGDINPKSQYRIKLKKNNLLDGMRIFSLLHLDKLNAPMALAYYLQEKHLGLSVNNKLVKLRINGVDQGVYFLEERLGKELLERNNLSGYDVIKFDNTWDHQYLKLGHRHPFVYTLASMELNNISGRDVGQKYILNNILNKKNDDVFKYIDKDYWAKYMAILSVFGDFQTIYGDNAKYIYNTSNGKVYPFLRTEHVLNKLQTTDSYSFDKFLFDTSVHDNRDEERSYTGIFSDILQDEEFRFLRNKYLYGLVKDKKKIIDKYDEFNKRMLEITDSDSSNMMPTRYFRIKAGKLRENLVYNFDMIERYLSYSKVYVSFNRYNDNSYILDIEADSNSSLRIKSLSINSTEKLYIDDHNGKVSSIDSRNAKQYFTSELFQLDLDKSLSIKPKRRRFRIYAKDKLNINNFDIGFENAITNENIPKNKILVSTSEVPLQDFEYKFRSVIPKYKGIVLDLEKKQYTFKSKEYIINDNLIFPYGFSVVIEKGSKIFLSKNKSIIVRGSLYVNGTKDNKVVITNLNNKSYFGTLASIGDSRTEAIVSYLQLSGGSESNIDGLFLSGGLSLYSNGRTIVKNSHIHNNGADDGLNIKNSEIILDNNTFSLNSSDQVDLDFCNGIVKNNRFVSNSLNASTLFNQSSEDTNGDGLDLSGSRVVVHNNKFDGFPDKGISVGERTVALVSNNRFINNRSAITVKDQSNVYIYNNTYSNNKLNIEMYRKKGIFTQPSLFNVNEKHNPVKIQKTKESLYYKSNGSLSINPLSEDIFDNLEKADWVEYE
jgi:hypothetical protein